MMVVLQALAVWSAASLLLALFIGPALREFAR